MFAALLAGHSFAQQQVRYVENAHIINDAAMIGSLGLQSPQPNGIQTVACGADTLAYARNKSNGLRVLNMNGANSAAAFGQYYDAPQPISVSKLRFHAYKLNTAGGPASNIVVEIYNARPDSLPLGAPLRTATVVVDTNFYGGSLEALEKVATFSSPVLLTGAYVVVVRNNSSNPMGIVVNDYLTQDGANEWLASAQFSGLWRHSYEVNVAAVPLNCDMLLDPVVSFHISANFTSNPACISAAGNVGFVNTSSPILHHRMYNVAAFLNAVGHSATWNFGDGSSDQRLATMLDTIHYYNAAGSYVVTLHDTLYGWTRNCAADTAIALGQSPESQFSHTHTNLVVQFTDQSLHNPTTWYWRFGDGTVSNLRNPLHTYTNAGSYQVCHWSISTCGIDSICSTVTVTCPAPTASFSSTTSNLTVSYMDWSTGGANAWEWNFGDSTFSTAQNPSHTYTAAGNYLVHLRTYNACGMDSSWYWLTLTCAAPVATFSLTTNLLTASFSNQSTGLGVSWSWDFGDGSNSAQLNPVHAYVNTGNYTVCLTATNACGVDVACESLSVSITGIDDAIEKGFQVYPNPAASVLQIAAQLDHEEPVQLVLCDLMGTVIKTIDWGIVSAAHMDIPVDDLAAGTYFLQIRTGSGTVVKQVAVLR